VRIVRHYRSFWTFVAVLAFCSFMVDRQFRVNQAKHNEVREAFILLNARGYSSQAQRLYGHLIGELGRTPDRVLLDDFQRTLMLVDPGKQQTNNLLWRYHWTVSNELERRSPRAFARALDVAKEAQ
jgi:hypothetical protein